MLIAAMLEVKRLALSFIASKNPTFTYNRRGHLVANLRTNLIYNTCIVYIITHTVKFNVALQSVLILTAMFIPCRECNITTYRVASEIGKKWQSGKQKKT